MQKCKKEVIQSYLTHVALITPLLKHQTHKAQFCHSCDIVYVKQYQQ